jgi:hypothetical protein
MALTVHNLLQGVPEEEQQELHYSDFRRRLRYAKNHYFSDTCDFGCPCHTAERINLTIVTTGVVKRRQRRT